MEPRKKNTCCVGLSYYTQEMRLQAREPICFGLQTSPASISELPSPADSRQQPNTEGVWAKHICVGCAFWQSAFANSSRSGAQLPHCEGVEVLLVRESANADADAAGAQLGEASTAEDCRQRAGVQDVNRVGQQPKNEQIPQSGSKSVEPYWARLWARAEKNIAGMQAQLSNQGLIKFKETPESYAHLQQRVISTASQNVERLITGANVVAASTYSVVLKPWISRWADRWNGSKDSSSK